jgi:hypothetical protein
LGSIIANQRAKLSVSSPSIEHLEIPKVICAPSLKGFTTSYPRDALKAKQNKRGRPFDGGPNAGKHAQPAYGGLYLRTLGAKGGITVMSDDQQISIARPKSNKTA